MERKWTAVVRQDPPRKRRFSGELKTYTLEEMAMNQK